MPQTASTHHPTRRTLRPALVPLVIALVAIMGTLLYQSASASAGPDRGARPSDPPRVVRHPSSPDAPSLTKALPGGGDGAAPDRSTGVTEQDGALPDGVTVLDDQYPGVANLDAALLEALRAAANDASRHGVALTINSGWRSAHYQDVLLREAVSKYGSTHEAARWVATAETSPHVSGDAVDIGSAEASAWLLDHGAAYGLCPVYGNEPWHYELRAEAVDEGCPRLYADPTRDPRMRR